MNTKKKSSNILFPILLLLVFLLLQCNNSEMEHKSHQVHHNLPDNENIKQLIISPNKLVLSRQTTIKLSTQNGPHTLKVQGYISLDRNRNQIVSARFGGRIEKLYVKYDLQFIKKGEKILELYSPELNTFQEEHLFLLESEKEKSILEQSRQKLKLYGITEFQISQLEKNKTFTQTITVYSPADGYVFFNTETNNVIDDDVTQKKSMNNMSMATENNSVKKISLSASQIREGIYINKGETFFSINDLRNVWAIVSLSPEFHSYIQPNSQIKIISELFPDKPLMGKIELIEQTYEENEQRFTRIRIGMPNSKSELKLNSLVTAEIPFEITGFFQIPASAVYRTGLNSFVWVKSGTTKSGTPIFQLRKVVTGLTVDGMVIIIKGLRAHEEIAEFAGFLTDSETFLNN